MPFLLQYLFKLSLTLAVLYLFYYILLRKLTFYTWNRFYLLCYSLLSFIIPFVNITPWIQDKPIAGSSLIHSVSFIGRLNGAPAVPPAAGTVSFSPYDIVLFLFAGGAVVMLVRLLLQFLSIQSIKRQATLIHANNVRLYDVDSPISPFSFAQSIFINTRQYSGEDLQKIIQHEFVHVKQRHTVDLLAGELLCIVNWYNPFAWLIRKAIRQNLEFIADHSVLQTGLDAQQYQYLLLQVTGLPKYSVSNNFNISSLKQRIFMMNKLQSARGHLLKFLFLLPVLALILLAFRGQQVERDSLSRRKDFLSDTVPPKPPAPPAMKAMPRKFIPPPPPPSPPPPPPPLPKGVSSITISNKATVLLKNGKKEEYDLDNWQEKAAYEKKYGILPPPAPVPVMSPDVIVTDKVPGKPAPLASPVIVNVDLDTVRISGKPVPSLSPVVIDTVDVDLDSVKIENDIRPVIAPKKVIPVIHSSNGLPPMYITNGVISSAADIDKMEGQQIKSITILKGEEATRLYGERAANGVVIISTKKGKITGDNGNVSFRVMGDINSLNNYKGLVIINGKEASKADVERMLAAFRKDPFMISLNITTLKKEEAVRKWGDKGKDGVTIVNFRRSTSN